MHGAQALFEPKGQAIEFGIVREGMLADLVVVGENPIDDLKVLYGTGAVRLNDETGMSDRVGGVVYTIKDGIVYDARSFWPTSLGWWRSRRTSGSRSATGAGLDAGASSHAGLRA